MESNDREMAPFLGVPWHFVLGILALVTLCFGCGNGEQSGDVASGGNSGQTVQEERICPQCQRHYFGGERFCMIDRAPLVSLSSPEASVQKVCPVCARKFPAGKKFCIYDGSPLEEVSEDAAVADAGDETATEEAEPTPTPKPKTRSGSQASTTSGRTDIGRTGHSGRSTRPRDTRVASSDTSNSRSGRTGRDRSGYSNRESRHASRSTPTPRPVRVTPVPYKTPKPYRVAQPTPTPYPVPVATPIPTPIPTPVPTPVPTPIPVPEPTQKPVKVASVPAATPVPARSDVQAAKDPKEIFAKFDEVSERASTGKLDSSEIAGLMGVDKSSNDFTRSRALLAMNFKGRDQALYRKALTEILSIPENHYNPVYNLEMAEFLLLSKKYQKSVKQIRLVDRYKQRFPRGVYYKRVARMYEVEAKALEGMFNSSEDVKYLEKAISTWKKYLTHVKRKNDAKQTKLAEEYIAKLEKIMGRMQ